MRKLIIFASIFAFGLFIFAGSAHALTPQQQKEAEKMKAELDKQFNDIMRDMKRYMVEKRIAKGAEAERNRATFDAYLRKMAEYKSMTGLDYQPFRVDPSQALFARPNSGGDFNSSADWINKIKDENYQTLGFQPTTTYNSTKTCDN